MAQRWLQFVKYKNFHTVLDEKKRIFRIFSIPRKRWNSGEMAFRFLGIIFFQKLKTLKLTAGYRLPPPSPITQISCAIDLPAYLHTCPAIFRKYLNGQTQTYCFSTGFLYFADPPVKNII
jgi:hypothetical protein